MRRLGFYLLLCLWGVTCGAVELTISAASSLVNVFPVIGKAFETANPAVQLRFNFAASDALLQQVAQGAPVDVLATADQFSMDRAEQKGLLAKASRRNFASNQLVLVTPLDSVGRPKTLADLNQPAIERIVLGQPDSVPAGRYAKAALSAHGVWQGVQGKLVFAHNVRQALDYVTRGEVSAGFVYATDALQFRNQVNQVMTVPIEGGVKLPVAVVRETKHVALAQQFVRFLATPAARTILLQHGFGAE